jgi:hypothetical protein
MPPPFLEDAALDVRKAPVAILRGVEHPTENEDAFSWDAGPGARV